MKRYLPTIILVIVCVAGFWYASSNNFFREKKEEPIPLTAVQKNDVQGLKMVNDESGDGTIPLIELRKEEQGWSMTAPAAYPLNSYSADSWVNAFSSLTSDKLVEEQASDMAKYGLDKPRQQFMVTMKDGSNQTLLLGIDSPISGYYVKTTDSNTVYQISEEQIKPLQKKPFEFIDKSPFLFEYNKLKSLTINLTGEQWTLTKMDLDKMAYESRWKLGELELTADEGTSFLDRIINTSTNQMLQPIAEVKLDAPELKIDMVVDKNGKEETLSYLGQAADGETVWIGLQGGQWAYALTIDQAQGLYDKAEEVVMQKVQRMQQEQAQQQ